MAIEGFKTFLGSYIECAEWAENCSLTDDEIAQAAADCRDFMASNAALLEGIDAGQAGHDFWLTRAGHGAGFWDRGLGERGELLTQAAKLCGAVYLTNATHGDDEE